MVTRLTKSHADFIANGHDIANLVGIPAGTNPGSDTDALAEGQIGAAQGPIRVAHDFSDLAGGKQKPKGGFLLKQSKSRWSRFPLTSR